MHTELTYEDSLLSNFKMLLLEHTPSVCLSLTGVELLIVQLLVRLLPEELHQV